VERALKGKWLDREQLAEILFLNERQVTKILSFMRTKSIPIVSRPHETKHGYKEYTLSKDPKWTQGVHGGDKGLKHLNRLLIAEMNKILAVCESNKSIPEISKLANRSLQACGVKRESVSND